MRPAILKHLLLTLLLAFAASSTVNAKLASGPQTLGLDLHQAASLLEAAPRLGWSGSSYDGASESPVATRGGTEVVQRAVSRAELESIQRTGVLSRGGRPGDFFASPSINSNANRARQRLALPNRPDARVTLEVPSGVFSQPTRVGPLRLEGGGTLPGGGLERIAPGSSDIPVRILRVDEF